MNCERIIRLGNFISNTNNIQHTFKHTVLNNPDSAGIYALSAQVFEEIFEPKKLSVCF